MSKSKILILSLVFVFSLGLFFCFSQPTQAFEIREDLFLHGTINPWSLTKIHDLFIYHELNAWGPIINNVPGGDSVVIGDHLDVHGEIFRKWGPVQIKDGIEQKGGELVKFSGKVEMSSWMSVKGDIVVGGNVDGVDISAVPYTYLRLSGGTLTGNLSLASGKKVDGVDVSTIPFTYLALSGGALTGPIIVSGVSGLTDADIPNNITASNYLPLSGGTISGNLTVSNKLAVGGTIDLTSMAITPANNADALIVKESTGAFNAITLNEDGKIISYDDFDPSNEKATLGPGYLKVEDTAGSLSINSDAEIWTGSRNMLIKATDHDIYIQADGITSDQLIQIRADGLGGNATGTIELGGAKIIPWGGASVDLGEVGKEWHDLHLFGNLQGVTGVFDTSVTSPLYTGTGDVTLSSGVGSNLILDSKSGVLQLASGTNTIDNLQDADLKIRLPDQIGFYKFVITNSVDTEVASISSLGDLDISGDFISTPFKINSSSSYVLVEPGITLKVDGSVEGIESHSHFIFGVSGAVAAGAMRYMNPGSGTPNASEISVPIPENGTIKEMWVYAAAAPGVGVTDTMTVRHNGGNTTMTVSLTGPSQTGHDNMHSFDVSAGDRVSISYIGGGGSAASDVVVTLIFKIEVE